MAELDPNDQGPELDDEQKAAKDAAKAVLDDDATLLDDENVGAEDVLPEGDE
jgi:hypothetical protein